MAVSFKVPASPKKDIFVIDQFLGVDLTNTGSNIDEIRSPNAENMVRYVPGKVRKRMGYSVPVEFSEGKDVNRAINSSDENVDIEFDENGDAFFYIYDDHTDKCYLHFYLSYVGDYTIYITNKDNSHWDYQAVATEDEPMEEESRSIYGYTCSPYGGFSHMRIHKNSSGDNDYCKIRSLRMNHSTKATSRNEYTREILWKAAPEDKGNVFVKTANTLPLYGHHTLKTGRKQGDFVTNVNRLLGTSGEFVELDSNLVFYELGENLPANKPFFLSFDLNDSGGAVNAYICTNPYVPSLTLIDTVYGDHFEIEYTSNHDEIVYLVFNTTGVSREIKNIMVSYARTEDAEWSAAPEDDGAEFDIDSVYQITGDNTAISSEAKYNNSFVNGQSQVSLPMVVQLSTGAVTGKLTIIEGYLTVDTEATNIDMIELFTEDGNGNISMLYGYDYAPNNKHIRLYIKPTDGNYIRYVELIVILTSAVTSTKKCNAKITNLTVYEGIEKTDFWSSEYVNLYHVGRDLYLNKSGTNTYSLVFSDMKPQRSMSWQFEARDNDSAVLGYDNLYIVDGQTYLEYNGAKESVTPVNGSGKIPLITIARSPSIGGTPYDPVNRLQPGFEEQFIGDGTSTAYFMSFTNLDHTQVRVWIKSQDEGIWVEQEYGTAFDVNYEGGVINFVTAPWDNTQQGEDNVKIRAFRTIERYVNSINKCSFGTLFGVGGTSDRLFLSGNPDTPNYDYFSKDYDPTYFPDTYYGVLGVSASEIKGYARVNNYLATFKDENEPSQSVFIREGDLIVSESNVSEPAFKLINTLQGNGAISPYTFGYLQTEPLFLTKSGIYAITAQDITGEKYGQSRSFYLNGQMLKEDNISNACAVVYNDQYILAINSHLYVLDGLQATRTDKSEPYATRQYVGYYCTNIPANVMWTYNDSLWFGTNDGRVCKFATDVESLDSYSDDGEPIYCCWETPDLDGKLFYKNKTFRYFAIRMMSAMKTSVKMFSQRLGEWTFIKETASISKIFDFNDIDFNLFTFRSDNSEKVAHAKIRVKKVDKARFRVENGNLNEPFGLFDFALEYIESGNYKR